MVAEKFLKQSMKNLKIFLLIFSFVAIFSAGYFFNFTTDRNILVADDFNLDEQNSVIRSIKSVMPAVVNVVVYDKKEIVNFDLQTGKKSVTIEQQEVGAGTGFLISSDGLIITNKHVIETADEKTGIYRVILSGGKKYYGQLIGSDPLNDLAILKIYDKDLPFAPLGDSDSLELGTTVIAIGNALGKYQNTVTKGIVSGLSRSVVASNQSGNSEYLENIIQTDAEINMGNSGGPLVDLHGKVVGINSALDQGGGSIGFAIPINDAKPVINSVKEIGRIKRPQLGVMHIMLNLEISKELKLNRDTGALIVKGDGAEPAILSGSAADKAGLEEGDIIFEINAIKINKENTLSKILQKYKPGDRIGLKVQRGEKELIIIVVLEEYKKS